MSTRLLFIGLLAALIGWSGLAAVAFAGAVACVAAWIVLGPRWSFLV